MSQRWKIALLSAALATAPLAACAGGPPPRDRVYIREGPPGERTELIVARPGPEYVWIRGHYAYAGGGYAWVPGRWARPDGRRRWADGRWAHDRRGWYYIDGHWR
ncbi:MAG: hypothetical protein ABI446_15050 [Gemmatimonadaceae bacterium]